ncbi:MAG: radical SAM protein, partial [Bacteroidota bacterium]|nr:radical SAM protein [Bacteroidota bacterium]
MEMFKSSPYNVLIPVEESAEYLLFNTLTGGIEVFARSEGEMLAEIFMLKEFSVDSFGDRDYLFEYLLEREYVLEAGKNIIDVFEKYTERNQFKNSGTIFLTIGTTITCNMGCPYCFEFVKPNHTLKDDKVKAKTVDYIEQIICKADRKIHSLNVTWYGGEPLINVKAIIDISKGFFELSEKYQLDYDAKIITNGIYLTEENVRTLITCRVSSAQVTIDGAKRVHDKKRPLKQKNGENYFKILKNLALLPEGININVRLNVDKEVAASAEDLLDDLNAFKIWPHKHRQFNFDPAWLRSYEEIKLSEEEQDTRIHVDEFFEFKQNFRLSLVRRLNSWAERNGGKRAKLKWDLPKYQSTCATWASPVSLVVDPNGYIHKCWETIHDDSKAPTSIFEEYNPAVFEYYSSFNRYTHNNVCRNCKYLPVCDKISCSH